MRVVIFTAMYPSRRKPAAGIFVKEQVDSLRLAGVDVDVFSFEGKRSAMNYLKAGLALRRKVAERGPDLVHAHYGLNGAAALLQHGCPVVTTFHGSDLLGEVGDHKRYTFAGRVKTLISRAGAFGAAERIIVASQLKSKLKPLSTVTIPMGVDLDLFKPMPMEAARQRLGWTNQRRFVLFAAHPNNNVKRYDVARAAVDLLKAEGLDVELLAVHSTPHDQMPLYMNACNVLVLTSMHEASPCVIKEAMACNLPIVSVNVGDVPVQLDGVQGAFMCERTPEAVAAGLRQTFRNPGRTDGRQKISTLALPNVAGRVKTVYKQVLSANKSALTSSEAAR